jgi:hypothetical protein
MKTVQSSAVFQPKQWAEKGSREDNRKQDPTRTCAQSGVKIEHCSRCPEKRMFMLFPTPMFMGKLPDMSVCDRVEKKVRELQKSGKGRASPKGASPAWMSPDDLTIYPR